MRTASPDSPRRSPETTTRSRRRPSRPPVEDDADDVTSVEVEVTPQQLDWLRQKADTHDVTLSAVVRAVVDEQTGPRPSQKRSTDAASNGASEGASRRPKSDSLLDDLKNAQQRLESLVNGDEDSVNGKEDDEESGRPNVDLQSLVDRLNDRTPPEDTTETDDGPSPLEEGLAALEEGTDAGDGSDEEEEVNSLFDVPDDA